MSPSTSKPTPGPPSERRRNATLREVLDELVEHVRKIARGRPQMTTDELDYAQERLQWLADEVWRLAVSGDDPLE